jgi:hypothetical protein
MMPGFAALSTLPLRLKHRSPRTFGHTPPRRCSALSSFALSRPPVAATRYEKQVTARKWIHLLPRAKMPASKLDSGWVEVACVSFFDARAASARLRKRMAVWDVGLVV